MRNYIACALLLLGLFNPPVYSAGMAHQGVATGYNQPQLSVGQRYYLVPTARIGSALCGDGQVGVATIATSFYRAASVNGDVFWQPNVSGIAMRVQWCGIEQSPGVFTYTDIQTVAAQVTAHGGHYLLTLVSRSFSGSHGNQPTDLQGASYEIAATGGGFNLLYGSSTMATRAAAMITSITAFCAADSSCDGVSLDEFASGNTAVQLGFADNAAEIAAYETYLYSCQAALSTKPCFLKLNVLAGDDGSGTGMGQIITDCAAHASPAPCLFSQELGMPIPYDYRFPRPNGTSVGTSGRITQWMERGRTEFACTRPMLLNIDTATNTTWSAATKSENTIVEGYSFIRYFAYVTAGLCGTTRSYFPIVLNNGGSSTSGIWAKLGSLITNQVLSGAHCVLGAAFTLGDCLLE